MALDETNSSLLFLRQWPSLAQRHLTGRPREWQPKSTAARGTGGEELRAPQCPLCLASLAGPPVPPPQLCSYDNCPLLDSSIRGVSFRSIALARRGLSGKLSRTGKGRAAQKEGL